MAALATLTSPADAAVAANDTFTLDIAGFNSTSGVGYILGGDLTATFGTTQTFTAAGYNGQDITVSSHEVVGASTTTDFFKISTPTNFLTSTTVNGTKITSLQFDIGDANSGVTTGAPDPVNLATSISSDTATGSILYGTANTGLTLMPTVTLGTGGFSFTAVEGVNAGTTAISTFAIHEFDFSITYSNPVVVATTTTITNTTPLQSTYGQPYSISVEVAAATGSTQPTTGNVTCTVQPQPSGSATTIGPVSIAAADATAQCPLPATLAVGNYNVTATYGGSTDAAFSGSTSANAALTIVAEPLTISAQSQTKVYDGTTDSSGTPTITSGQLATGDVLSALAQTFTSPNVQGTDGSTLTVSPGFTLTNNGSDVSSNYQVTLATAQGTITPAALTITPTAGQTKVYGTSDPALFTYTASGLIGTSVVSGALARVAGENVGSYAYTLGSVGVSDATNYTLSLAAGNTFAITPATTSVALSSACSSVFVGGGNEPYTVSASVSPASGSGTVTFSVGSSAVCSNVSLSSVSASCTFNDLDVQAGDPIDTLQFTANYSGDTNTSAGSATWTATVIGAAEAIFRNGFEEALPGCPIE